MKKTLLACVTAITLMSGCAVYPVGGYYYTPAPTVVVRPGPAPVYYPQYRYYHYHRHY